MKRSTLLVLTIISAIFCALIQYWLGNNWGVYIFTLLVLVYAFSGTYKYNLAKKWAMNPAAPPAADLGKYEVLIDPLYKYTRQQAKEIQNLRRLNSIIIASAQAFPSAAITLNTEFHVEWCNKLAKTYLGLDLSKDQGFNIFNILRIPEFYDYICKREWQEPFITEITHEDTTRTLSFTISMHSRHGYLLLCSDITQLKRLRTTQSDFVANVSHEIRTPLTVLIGFLETLRDLPNDAISTTQRRQYENLMLEQAQRMQAIVSDLLTLSTLESTHLSNGETLQLSLLIEVVRRQIETLSAGRHQFSYDIDPTLMVYGNRNELLSAITNLLTNAVRYTPDGGSIHVSWRRNKLNQMVFSVTDTGLGIEAKDIPRLTERFYRVDKSRSRASGGTGLGLAITKHIVIRHKFKLNIQSKLNKGSTFSIIFTDEHITDTNDIK